MTTGCYLHSLRAVCLHRFHSQYTVVLQLGIERQGGGCGWMMMDVDGGCGGRMPQRDAKGEVLKVS